MSKDSELMLGKIKASYWLDHLIIIGVELILSCFRLFDTIDDHSE